jgi:hypothetical protein
MFNDDKKIMQNHKNYKSFLIQILVQNYLEHEYQTENVFIYPELVNDLDIFSKDLKTQQNLLNARGTLDYGLTIRAFLDEIDGEEYIQSCEIKSGEKQYICAVKNLNQILTKIKYPVNTKLLLTLVPIEFNVDKTNLIDVDKFNRLKNEILQNEHGYDIINSLINDTDLANHDINSALTSILGKLRKGTLKTQYKNNITEDQYEGLMKNFEKVELRIITFEDLEKYPIGTEYIHSLLSRIMYN